VTFLATPLEATMRSVRAHVALLRNNDLALVAGLSGLLLASVAAPGWAGFVPLDNQSTCFAHARAEAVVDNQQQNAVGTFVWDGQVHASADDLPIGQAFADMYVSTATFGDTCMIGDAEGGGFGDGSDYGFWGYGHLNLLFVVNQTQQYAATVGINLKDLPGSAHFVELTDLNGNPYWHYESGATAVHGRIAPGAYWLKGKTDWYQTTDAGECPSFSVSLCVSVCTPIISVQPLDRFRKFGETINLQVVAVGGAASAPNDAQVVTTYQWRKNLQNLANGGRISGVNTADLSITNAVAADSGLYDVIVTQGTIVEPSREARVVVSATVAVEPGLAASELRLAAPRPNPFLGNTRLEFELARSGTVSLMVTDALGRRVKELMPVTSMPAGRYAVDWNGTDAEGHHVASGVYFVQLMERGTRRVQRAVLLPR
jgi:hypothetical protein